jgi:hypothetical protein
MELGHFHLQIFVSSVVILGTAAVALICDFLKRNNEQLRELTIELQIRHEEEQRRSHLLTPRPAERVDPAPKTEKIAVPAPTPAVAVPNLAVPDVTAPKQRSAAGRERKRTINTEAVAAMERGAALAGSGGRPRSTAPAAPVVESKPEPIPEVIVVSQEQKPGAAKKDWGSLLSRSAQKPAAAAPAITVNDDLLAQVVAATNHSTSKQDAGPFLPAGFQDGFVLNQLVQTRQPISGLVVSIGVKASGSLPQSVHKLVQSLIGPHDFAAQSSDDEFLLIYPQERGASAQRRLSQIAQQLWDFQLRSLGSFQILFSWGGVEVRSESIEEAIASASERMQETKRGRKLLTMWSPAPPAETHLRQAV